MLGGRKFETFLQPCQHYNVIYWSLKYFYMLLFLKIEYLLDERWPLMEDNLWWMTTFGGSWPLMEDNLWWRKPFNERKLLMEDNIWLKTTFDKKQPLMEDILWWKTTFNGGQPIIEDNLWWKTSLDETLMEDNFWWKIWERAWQLMHIWVVELRLRLSFAQT